MENNEEKFKEFESMLRRMDWNYDYSDDNRVYRRGYEMEKELNRLYAELSMEDLLRTVEIWNKYCPKKQIRNV